MKLDVKNLKKTYRKKIALTDINESFGTGVYGVLGPNGAGKTTLLNILATSLSPSGGDVYYDGKAIHRLGETYRAVLGYLPQKMDFYNHFTGYDFLRYMCILKCDSKSAQKKEFERLDALLRRVHLYDVRNHKIGTYSGGMKQRLAIAQAFIGEPEILLLDEPTVGLDLEERAEFKKMVREQGKRAIVILSTHIVSDVEETADFVLFMSEGKIIERNTQEYFADYMEKQGIKGLENYYLQLAGRGLNDSTGVV